MAAAPDLRIYPFADTQGNIIPLDIIDYLGLIRQPFTGAAVNNIVIPTCDFLVLWADQDCLIQLDANAAVPANGVHTVGLINIPARMLLVVYHAPAAKFGVISEGVSGVLKVQTCLKWKAIPRQKQFDRM